MQQHRFKTKGRVSPGKALQEIAIRLTQEPVVISDSSIPKIPMMDVLANHLKEQEIQIAWDYFVHPTTLGSDRSSALRELDANIRNDRGATEAERHAVRNYRAALDKYRLFPSARKAFRRMADDDAQKSREVKLFETALHIQPKDDLVKIVPLCIKRLNDIIGLENDFLAPNEDPKVKMFGRGLEYFREQHLMPPSVEAILHAGATATLSPETEARIMSERAGFIFEHQSILKFACKALEELTEVRQLLQRGRAH